MYDLSVVAILADPHFFVLVMEVTHQPKIASAFRAFFFIHKPSPSRLIAVGIPPRIIEVSVNRLFAGAQCDIIIVTVAAIVDEMTRYIHSFRSVYGIFVLNLRKIGRNRLQTFTKVYSRFLAEPNGVKTDFKNCAPNPRVLEGVTLTALPWRSGIR